METLKKAASSESPGPEGPPVVTRVPRLQTAGDSALSRAFLLGGTLAPLRRGSVGHSPREVHVVSSKILFRGERIVRAAPELEVVERRWPTERVGVTVVDLESEGLATSLASIVPVGASLAVAVEHRAAHGCGDVTSAAPRWSRRSGIRRSSQPNV